MSDFLGALVARAQGRLPVLERRARSLFEPATGAPVVTALERNETLDGEAVSRADVSTAGPPLGTAGHRHVDADALAPLAPPRRAASPADPARRAAPGAATGERESGRVPAPTALAEVAPTPPTARRAIATTAAVTVPNRAATADPRPDSAMPPLHPPRRTIEPASGHARPGTAPRDAAPTALLARSTATRPLPAAQLAKARAGTPTRHPGAPAGAVPAAPVHISIGRVEIRAVQAPAERPRGQAPAAPRLSLDDYLRSRDGAVR